MGGPRRRLVLVVALLGLLALVGWAGGRGPRGTSEPGFAVDARGSTGPNALAVPQRRQTPIGPVPAAVRPPADRPVTGPATPAPSLGPTPSPTPSQPPCPGSGCACDPSEVRLAVTPSTGDPFTLVHLSAEVRSRLAGAVMFYDGDRALAISPVVGRSATMSTDQLGAGRHRLLAMFVSQDRTLVCSSAVVGVLECRVRPDPRHRHPRRGPRVRRRRRRAAVHRAGRSLVRRRARRSHRCAGRAGGRQRAAGRPGGRRDTHVAATRHVPRHGRADRDVTGPRDEPSPVGCCPR